jgi:Family of unknown function (DUF6090)
MAEQEVVKHTKKIYKVWTSKEHNLWHKVKEFLIEIFIIVFAITLSIWVHNRSEHAHQQKETKEFLLGLKDDLTNDMKELENDLGAYHRSSDAFTFISRLRRNEPMDKDSFNFYAPAVFNIIGFLPNNGRFEGFKSSGKIGTIEDAKLQNDIMDLYQEDIPILTLSTEFCRAGKTKLGNYVEHNRKRTSDSTNNILSLFSNDEVYYVAKSMTDLSSIYDQYGVCISKMQKIISSIDSTYTIK